MTLLEFQDAPENVDYVLFQWNISRTWLVASQKCYQHDYVAKTKRDTIQKKILSWK